MGMAWYKFYTYVCLPLIVVSLIRGLISNSQNLFIYFHTELNTASIPRYIVLIIAIILITINVLLIYGMYFKKLWAWYLNLVYMAFFIIIGNLSEFKEIKLYICYILISFALWLYPNYVYFKRRKFMFE